MSALNLKKNCICQVNYYIFQYSWRFSWPQWYFVKTSIYYQSCITFPLFFNRKCNIDNKRIMRFSLLRCSATKSTFIFVCSHPKAFRYVRIHSPDRRHRLSLDRHFRCPSKWNFSHPSFYHLLSFKFCQMPNIYYTIWFEFEINLRNKFDRYACWRGSALWSMPFVFYSVRTQINE